MIGYKSFGYHGDERTKEAIRDLWDKIILIENEQRQTRLDVELLELQVKVLGAFIDEALGHEQK